MGPVINLDQMFHGELGVTLRGREAFVAEHLLNGPQVCAFFEQMRAERMAKRVRVNVGRESLGDCDLFDDAANAARGKAPAAPIDQES